MEDKEMGGSLALTALVTGFPEGLRQPKPLPGENLSQLVIRNHPREWLNFIARLTEKLQLSPDEVSALRASRLNVIQSAQAQAEIERFMNLRLPAHGRTIQCLKKLQDLQEKLQDEPPGMPGSYNLIEILWPRQRDTSGDSSAERRAASLGVDVISMPSNASLLLDLANVFPHLHGDLIWLVPGGTKFSAPIVDLQLRRVVRRFQESPRCAMYTDNASSLIYRVSALREVHQRGLSLPSDSREMARTLHLAGHEIAMDHRSDDTLCELEPEYGGPRRKIQHGAEDERSWWKRWFGR